jgi:hypothetical protein
MRLETTPLPFKSFTYFVHKVGFEHVTTPSNAALIESRGAAAGGGRAGIGAALTVQILLFIGSNILVSLVPTSFVDIAALSNSLEMFVNVSDGGNTSGGDLAVASDKNLHVLFLKVFIRQFIDV